MERIKYIYVLFHYSSGDDDAFTSSEGNSVILPDSSAVLVRFSVDPPPLCDGSGSLVLPMPSLAPPPAMNCGFYLFIYFPKNYYMNYYYLNKVEEIIYILPAMADCVGVIGVDDPPPPFFILVCSTKTQLKEILM